jgi:GNAT superfamily N-acetyltransferase
VAEEQTVRTATDADHVVLQEVFRRASLSNDGDREALLETPDALVWDGDQIAAGRTLVAVDAAGRILGFATAVPYGDGLELEDLFVDPDAMRRGVATRLVRRLLQDAADGDLPWIEVTANPHAAAFYASVGFTEVGQVQTRFAPAPRLRAEP